jgi:hypothetical protein
MEVEVAGKEDDLVEALVVEARKVMGEQGTGGEEQKKAVENEEKEKTVENVVQDDKDDMRMQDDDREEKQQKVKETACAEVLLMMEKAERDILDKERTGKDGTPTQLLKRSEYKHLSTSSSMQVRCRHHTCR